MRKSFANIVRSGSLLLIILSLLVGCNFPTATNQPSTYSQSPSNLTGQANLITFKVTVSQPLPAGDSIFISVLDEVTGLAFNPHKYIMQAEDALTYTATLPFTMGSVIKYRYSREGTGIVNEHLYNDRPVRYRLFHVDGPATLQDVVSRWTDTESLGPGGRIMGHIYDHSSGNPIPNILVSAGGEQALSLADGSFLLEGLPPGTHNLVFYSLDGAYRIFQQGAVVAADSTTPVEVQLNPAKWVTVIFTIKVPLDTPPDAPIRMAGNIYQLGNTFADLSGGVSTLASRMPSLGKLPDGRYMLTINLPVGTYLEYKYTLGDGLWSSELTSKGASQVRQLIIPEGNYEVDDVVETWKKVNSNPIRFEVKVPSDTPHAEAVSIQFNPGFGWLEPLPMWQVENTQGEEVWRFDLTGPFNDLATLKYRYCRQAQCASADDAATQGINPDGRLVDPSSHPVLVQDEILSWAWLSHPNESSNVPGVKVTSRGIDFIAGVSFQSNYHPSWGPLFTQSINNVRNLEVNWLFLSPTWTFTNTTPPILEPLPSQDILWPDLINSISAVQQQDMQVGLFPLPHFPTQVGLWWQNASRDYPWWVSFFERYSYFILHHASLASSTNVSTLIMGGDWLNPALPGGQLYDGSYSNVPQDAELRWRDLIGQVRERFSGTVAWALPYPSGVRNPPPFLDAVDQVYILWSGNLGNQPNTSLDDLQIMANAFFTDEIVPFQQALGKPVIFAISSPSIDAGTHGCIPNLGDGCLDYDWLYPPNPDYPEVVINLQDQANAYNAILSAINDHTELSGFVSMGYYPPAVLQDKSISIHGKPASGVVWYWSQKFLGR